MPELPEVETIARQLGPLVCGQTVRRLSILDPKLALPSRPALAGRKILAVGRAGKEVAFHFSPRPGDGRPLWLAVHLRMTGQLTYEARPGGNNKHRRATLTLTRGQIAFDDPRRFGVLRLGRTPAELFPARALDPTDPSFTTARLSALLRAARQPLKPWLLRQDRLVGLGNYLASEILFAAQISPQRRASSLRGEEVRRLHRAILATVGAAIERCGTTFSDYRDANGESGSFQAFLAVYGRAGQPCRRCAQPIRRLVQAGRSTFYCPRCQSKGAAASPSQPPQSKESLP